METKYLGKTLLSRIGLVEQGSIYCHSIYKFLKMKYKNNETKDID